MPKQLICAHHTHEHRVGDGFTASNAVAAAYLAMVSGATACYALVRDLGPDEDEAPAEAPAPEAPVTEPETTSTDAPVEETPAETTPAETSETATAPAAEAPKKTGKNAK